MKSIQAIREARAKLVAAAKQLVEDNPGEKWTEEVQAQYDDLKAQVEAKDAEVKRLEEIRDMEGTAPAGMSVAEVASRSAEAANVEMKAKPVYRNLGEQLQDVRSMTMDTGDSPKARDRFTKVVNAAGAQTGIDSEGGYLVETDKSKDIIETAVETGVISSRCSRQPIGADADSFSYMASDDRDRSTGTMGGIQVYRKGEAEAMVSSGKAKLTERELRVEDMYGLVYVTNRMLRDAVALAEFTKRNLRKQLAWKLDYECMYGSGVGQALGIMNSDLPVSVAKETSQADNTIVAENVVNMLARFRGDIMSAAWFVNQDVLPQFPLMSVGDQPVFIPGGSFSNAPFGMLFGRPIVPVEFCESVGSLGDIILADWSEYLLIEKGAVEEAESIHVKFLTDETAYRFIVRNNGQPMHDQPITPFKGTNTLSPFVMLAARTS